MKVRAAVPVKDEEDLLPAFLRHYGRFCDSIVVWDNGSSDRTLEIARSRPNVEVRSFGSAGFDTASVLAVLGETRRESVGRFDWCLFPDCDEFVVARTPGAEREILESAYGDVIRPTGYCLVQGPEEAPFDPSRDPLAQRRWGYRSDRESTGREDHYSKPIVLRPEVDLEWAPGRHDAKVPDGRVVESRRDLLLVHCDTVDFALWRRRKMRPISPDDRRRSLGVRRWDRPSGDYDALWAEEAAKARFIGGEIPAALWPAGEGA